MYKIYLDMTISKLDILSLSDKHIGSAEMKCRLIKNGRQSHDRKG